MAQIDVIPSIEVILPILRELSNESLFSGEIPLVVIQHLLPDTLEFLTILAAAGFGPIIVFGIPYSNKKPVIEKLQKDGFNVNTPDLKNLNDPEYWDKTIGPLLETWKVEGKNYAILEDGGYLGDILHKFRPEYLENCIGAVEQTKKGLWKYQSLDHLKIPVYTIADSRLKFVAEAPEVGNAIARSLDNSLNEIGTSLSQKKVAVMGYGWIGSSLTKSLEARGADVMVFDIDFRKMLEAKIARHKIVHKDEAVKKADIIIGCTGKGCLCQSDYKLIKDEAILVNATSQYIEFDIEWIYENSSFTNKLTESVKEFRINGKKVRVVYDGAPINFASSNSVPPKIMDIVISELFLCLKRITQDENKNKIYHISAEDEEKISELYIKLHN